MPGRVLSRITGHGAPCNERSGLPCLFDNVPDRGFNMKRIKMGLALCGVCAGGLLTPARADIRLPGLFSDHMVLQREIPIPVWGWAEPGAKVSVKLAGQGGQGRKTPVFCCCRRRRQVALGGGAH